MEPQFIKEAPPGGGGPPPCAGGGGARKGRARGGPPRPADRGFPLPGQRTRRAVGCDYPTSHPPERARMPITITLPDGSSRQLADGATRREAAGAVGARLGAAAAA